jgi:hypothetical protein
VGSSFWVGIIGLLAYSCVAEKVSLPLPQGPSRPGPQSAGGPREPGAAHHLRGRLEGAGDLTLSGDREHVVDRPVVGELPITIASGSALPVGLRFFEERASRPERQDPLTSQAKPSGLIQTSRRGPVVADRLRGHHREPAVHCGLVPGGDRGAVAEHADRGAQSGGSARVEVVGRAPPQSLARAEGDRHRPEHDGGEQRDRRREEKAVCAPATQLPGDLLDFLAFRTVNLRDCVEALPPVGVKVIVARALTLPFFVSAFFAAAVSFRVTTT